MLNVKNNPRTLLRTAKKTLEATVTAQGHHSETLGLHAERKGFDLQTDFSSYTVKKPFGLVGQSQVYDWQSCRCVPHGTHFGDGSEQQGLVHSPRGSGRKIGLLGFARFLALNGLHHRG